MIIQIDFNSDEAIYLQLRNQIIMGIATAKLKEGDSLPSMRVLAKELRISVITTKRAYEDLERDGFIVTMVGKGSFVKAADTGLVREEQLKRIEELLSKVISIAEQSGIESREVMEILELLYQDE